MAGRRVLRKSEPKGGPVLPAPMLEMLKAHPESMGPQDLFSVVQEFAQQKRKHHETINAIQKAINDIYDRFAPDQRVRFFSMLYDRFAERYDEHMAGTGHYDAIRRVLLFGMPYLRLPILDLTAGTGEPLKYAVEFMCAAENLRGPFSMLAPEPFFEQTDLTYQIHANEISARMLARAEEKLQGIGRVGFTDYNALRLPDHLSGRFNTVLCSQTFHLIADEDKPLLAKSIHDALVPGGVAVVMEEDPFRITPSAPIEAVSLFLRSVVRPIKHRGDLIGLFINLGMRRLEERAVAPIDSEHSMRLHLFQK
ncbi:MAG: class I SAM-dependent methyltransferase [Candidatus Micrarchaeota archaeon]